MKKLKRPSMSQVSDWVATPPVTSRVPDQEVRQSLVSTLKTLKKKRKTLRAQPNRLIVRLGKRQSLGFNKWSIILARMSTRATALQSNLCK